MEAILDYCKDVLGLDRVVVPILQAPSEKTVEMRGVLHGARLVALVPLARGEFPLRGESETLLEKMLLAMKLKPSEVLVATWQSEDVHAVPDEIMHLAGVTGTHPVLLFGGPQAALRFAENEALGQWGVWGVSRILATHTLQELIEAPDLKRLAWVHLQQVMKHI